MLSELILLLSLILVNGFFSLAEMAVVSSRKARLKHEADRGRKNYRLALETAENPSRFLSTIQIVITLVGTLTGAIGGATVAEALAASMEHLPLVGRFAEPVAIGIVVILTTFVSVVLGELVPKNLALSRPESIAAFVIRPLRGFARAFNPLVRLLSGATDLVIRLFGISGQDEPAVTEEEVKVLIAQGTETGVFEAREREMVEGVLSLGDRRITSLMTPRTEVVTIDADESAAAFKAAILENSRYAYIPVVQGDLDRTLGLLPVKDALAAIVEGRFKNPLSLLRKPLMVPETMTALKAFAALRKDEASTALIVDEYGGVAGIVSLGDIMEAVIGELDRAGSGEEPEIMRRDDGSWLVDGSLPIERFRAELGIDELPGEGEYETVAGLVLDRMGSIPRAGDRCRWDGCLIEVVDMDGNRVDKVLVSKADEDEEPGEPEAPLWS